MFSDKFLIALRLNKKNQYELAQEVGLSPTILSKWVHGITNPKENNPYLLKLAKNLKISQEEIFVKKFKELK